jgi:hypothetical protein
MAAGADTQIVIGLRNAQFVEKDLRHIGIVVLPCMEDVFLYFVGIVIFDGATDGSGLDDLRTFSNDGEKTTHRVGLY